MTLRSRYCLAILMGLMLSLPGFAQNEKASNPFQYDSKAPLNIKEVGSQQQGDVKVSDIVFTGATDAIKAYLVTPPGQGPFAGILFVHWLGDAATTNRTEFLKEAIALAPRGAVCLLIDTMWAPPGWYEKRIPEEDYTHSINQVIDLRRAMDLLLSQPHVDSKRIAYVGHDFGAMYGVLMGAVDPRPSTYVFMAGNSSLVDWYLYAAQPKDLAAFKKQMSALDPVGFIGQIKNAPVFFQFSSSDEYIPQDNAMKFYLAANPRKQMATYKTDHSLKGKDVDADRTDWLVRELALAK